MDIQELRDHIDSQFSRVDNRLDRFEGKFDAFVAAQTTRNESDARDDASRDQRIEHLQGFSKLVITILLAVCGFFAAGYISFLKGS